MSFLSRIILLRATVIATESAPPETARISFVLLSRRLCVTMKSVILFSSRLGIFLKKGPALF